ncbi:polysaccharide deacetylase family protein [Rhizobium grahamii]|uniref:Polysaccharide deacetylase n=1 Tax=Rhizobium grahamii TaxID=1120045 RepID=A0A370KJS7_9HYPH|nr:polysaccharide deacetylase family protein [Rhizobium grahamii]RDJ06800.1 polysaccharide deacetylase [Rhizobium grahamii]
MSDDQTFAALRHELDRWQSAGRTARFWLRDDDAVEVTDGLEKLLDATRRASVPLTLAVIPACTVEALATRLAPEDHVLVAVHGWSHQNHASPDEKKQELGSHRHADVVLAELRNGLDRLRRLYGPKLIPMLVPPWNRISAELVAPLPEQGFEVLSVFGSIKHYSPIRLLNTHVDVVNARGQRGERPHADLVRELVGELQARFAGERSPGGQAARQVRPTWGNEPIGILTHHLVHGASEREFLARLFGETADHPAMSWMSARDLVDS